VIKFIALAIIVVGFAVGFNLSSNATMDAHVAQCTERGGALLPAVGGYACVQVLR
jgi:hypothetical protein